VTERTFPHRCASPSGLVVVLNRNGSIRRMEREDVVLNLFPGSEVEGGAANVWLRLRGGTMDAVPLLGPRSPGTMRATDDGFHVDGVWRGVRFALTLVLAESTPAWFWHLRLENTGTSALSVDAVYAQDLALAPYGAIRMNEYYVSQYVDHTPLVHPERGFVVASRQNLAVGGRTPWTRPPIRKTSKPRWRSSAWRALRPRQRQRAELQLIRAARFPGAAAAIAIEAYVEHAVRAEAEGVARTLDGRARDAIAHVDLDEPPGAALEAARRGGPRPGGRARWR